MDRPDTDSSEYAALIEFVATSGRSRGHPKVEQKAGELVNRMWGPRASAMTQPPSLLEGRAAFQQIASAVVGSGDALAFEIGTWNFGVNAARFGLAQYPAAISFTFITASITADAKDRLDQGRGARGLVDPSLPDAVQKLEEQRKHSNGK